jgi:hypothetical protein
MNQDRDRDDPKQDDKSRGITYHTVSGNPPPWAIMVIVLVVLVVFILVPYLF